MFIGINTIILPGVKIGNRVVVGAGSVVTRDIPDDSIAVGNPARVIGTFTDYAERIHATCLKDTDIDWSLGYQDAISSLFRGRPNEHP